MSKRQNSDRRHEDDSIALKYRSHFPIHEAVEANDGEAIDILVNRKDIHAYDETGKQALHIAAWKGHTSIVIKLLKLHTGVNAIDKGTGRSPLHYACLAGHVTVVEILLRQGAVVYEQDKDGTYPLQLAAEGGYPEVVEQLVSVGALVSCRDKVGAEPLHYGAKHNQTDVLTSLCKQGANLHSQDKDGFTPMHYSARHGCVNSLRRLFKLGASLNSQCTSGDTPLHLACKESKTSSIAVLAELGANMYLRNQMYDCAIHMAARLNLPQSMKQLLKSGVQVDTVHKKRKQAIHIAAEHGCIDVVDVLKRSKADFNAVDKINNRPLHYAVKAEQIPMILKLAELGVAVNAPGKSGNTVLHVATKERKTKIVDVLCRVKADCNIENKAAIFPLYYAAINEDVVTAQHLIRHGANPNKLNSEGDGMIHIMVEEEKMTGITTMAVLKADISLQNQDGHTCVHLACSLGHVKVLKHLKSEGVNFNYKNKVGLSALHVAAMKKDESMVDLLNDLGADLNDLSKDYHRDQDAPKLCRLEWSDIGSDSMEEYWKTKIDMTPVHMAVLFQHQGIVEHLVKACGADISIGNISGETVFHLAVLFNMLEWLPVLIQLGANRNCKDKLGRTPVHYAAHTGNLDCLRFLLQYGSVLTDTDNEGRQPLHYAAQMGHYLLLPEFTAQQRVDINCKDKHGRTPLHFACEKGMIDTIVELVQLKADVHAKDENGNTAVHIAAMSGCHETIVQLASLGCDIDIQNKTNLKTPLHLAGDYGKGDTMEYLLMCGADPKVMDKNGTLPSTFKLSGRIKRDVGRRIQENSADNSKRNKTGEIVHEGKMVKPGKQVDFNRLGVSVMLRSSTPVSPIIFFHRTPTDTDSVVIPLKGLEEVLSDIYELRVLLLDKECTMQVEIPMDGYPGKFECCLRTTDNKEYKEFTTSEENGIPVFVGTIPIQKNHSCKFAVVVRPKIYHHSVGNLGGTLVSDVDRRIRIEIPKFAFPDEVGLELQVLNTDDLEDKRERLFATDVMNVTTDLGQQPKKNVSVQMPLHTLTDDPNNVLVFAIENEEDIHDETRWGTVQSMSNDEKGSSRLGIEGKKRYAKEEIKRALQRETSVLFFYAVSQRKDNFLTIFECTTPGRFKRRSEFWKKEGFQLHPQIRHSGHFPAKPNQKFYFLVGGNVSYVGTDSRQLVLTFNPRSYKYHSFYIKRVNKKEPMIGEIQVMALIDASSDGVLVTSIPIEIPESDKCRLS